MELSYLKSIWLKLIACIYSVQNNELPTEIVKNPVQTAPTVEQDQDTHEDIPSENSTKRMFNGALSSKEQGQLFIGIEQSNHTVIQDAINHGANVNASINGLDPLQYAIRHGAESIIEYLIQAGAEVKDHHIQLAESQQWIYVTNLSNKDMVFHAAKDSRPILLQEIRQYQVIAGVLKEEKKLQEKKKTAQAKSHPSTAAAAALYQPTEQSKPQNTQEKEKTLSDKTKAEFSKHSISATTLVSSPKNDDDDSL